MMRKKNNKIILGIVVITAVFLLSVLVLFSPPANKDNSVSRKVVKSGELIVIDPEDINGLSDFADNVFVARVMEKEGTYYENVTGDPDTIYHLEVVKNIKGDLSTSQPVRVYQHGGVREDGTVYQPEGQVSLVDDNYYLFITANQGASSEEEKSIMTLPEGSILTVTDGVVPLGTDESKSIESQNVQKFQAAIQKDRAKRSKESDRLRFPQKDSEIYLSE